MTQKRSSLVYEYISKSMSELLEIEKAINEAKFLKQKKYCSKFIKQSIKTSVLIDFVITTQRVIIPLENKEIVQSMITEPKFARELNIEPYDSWWNFPKPTIEAIFRAEEELKREIDC